MSKEREQALEESCELLVKCISELYESIYHNTQFRTKTHKQLHEHNVRRIENRVKTINGTLRHLK